MFTKINIDTLATVAGNGAETSVYRAPGLHEIGSAVKLVQGGGGGSGSDCRAYYYYQSGPYGC